MSPTRCLLAGLLLLMPMNPIQATKGDWPRPRQNRALTALQPLPGHMSQAPQIRTRYDLGRSRPSFHPASTRASEIDRGLCLVSGALHCYDLNGELQWSTHPPGLNFTEIAAIADLDGDGQVEILLQAGRTTHPFGAAVIVGLDRGDLQWTYHVDPMSYAWRLYADRFLPDRQDQQVVVVMHGYPPDEDNGYIALFEYPEKGGAPVERWRYDFHAYTCFPTLLRTDLDDDGVEELCIQTHSRMWFLDIFTGQVKHFVDWDVAPANVRSYGLVRFVDLDGDGREDFLCIANFAQHHEVLLNRNGRMELAWTHGWPESVTTGKVATTWPEPPVADIDGDGRYEIIVSMFNSEDEEAWLIRAYDALTGELRFQKPGMIAMAVADVDGDGKNEIFAAASTDPTRTGIDGAAVLKVSGGELREIWQQDGAVPIQSGDSGFVFGYQDQQQILEWDTNRLRPMPYTPPAAPPGPDFSPLPAVAGTPPVPLLAVDVDQDGRNEIILYHRGEALILGLQEDGTLAEKGRYPSSGLPAFADLDGDGFTEIITGAVSATELPRLEAFTPGRDGRRLWSTVLPDPEKHGLPYGHPLYLQTGYFTGSDTPDLYVWAGLPLVRSLVLNGRTGKMVWESGEIEGIERYWGPSVNLAASWDFDGDGTEDLVFTNPDYFCVLSGPTGAPLLGPSFPPDIFTQPSQGLYSFPAILEQEGTRPLVCLAGAHYFVGAMSIDAQPFWYRLPPAGENRSGNEGFLPARDGRWLMGFGRQNGDFACVEVNDGTLRWELPTGSSCSDVATGDLDGDGRPEFLFGTSHGQLWAVRDVDGRPEILWQVDLPSGCGPPIIADVDGDGASEILVCTLDGYLNILGPT